MLENESYKKNANDLREWFHLDISEYVEFSKIKYFCKVKDGTHDTPNYVNPSNESFPLITSKDIINGRIDFTNAKHISNDDYIKINRRSDVKKMMLLCP